MNHPNRRATLITYHLIPHTHWDREWYLSFDHFRVMLVHLMDDLLDLLADQPDYAGFLLDGQTVVAEDYLDVRPDRRDELAAYVRNDRLWMGPWYVLPDSFLVSGEALVRNLALGRAQARAFGRSMDVGYIPDSFGHTAQLPQILQGFGIDNAIVWRGFGGEPGEEGSEYRWRSPDGSEVLMEHLSAMGYSGAYFKGDDPAAWRERFEYFRPYVDTRAQTSHRLVLSGGDHHWPAAMLPDVVAALNEVLDGKARVVHSSLGTFMAALAREAAGLTLPVVEGELRFGYRWAFNVTGGVYSSRMYLKQANAHAQRLLERYLEPLDVLSLLAGGRSQQPLLDHGWRYLLQNHPHDSICGCSIDPVHREMMTRYAKLDELGHGVERFAWISIAPDHEGEPGDDQVIVVFNPSPFERDEVVECAVDFFSRQVVVGLNPDVVPDPPFPPVEGFVIEEADGAAVPYEVVAQEWAYGLALNRHDYPAQSRVERFTVRMALRDLPPLGIRTLRIRRHDAFPEPPSSLDMKTDAHAVENAFVRVEVRDGGAFFVTDRDTGVRFGPLGYFEDGADAGDQYNYSPPSEDAIVTSLQVEDFVVESLPGPLRAGLRVRGTWRLPRGLSKDLARRMDETVVLAYETTAWLTPFSRHVAFETMVENAASDHRLRVLFDTSRRTNRHHADNAFAVLSREQHAYDPVDFAIEVPAAVASMHRFVTVEDDEAGATLLADGLPEYELKHDSGGVLALTLLRCVGELGRDGLLMRPGGQGGWRNATPDAQCLGRHRFRYAFLPHAAGWPDRLDAIHRAAESLLLPPRLVTRRNADLLHPDRSFLSVEPSTLVLSALKEARDGSGVIVRVYNPSPKPIQGTMTLGMPAASVRRANLEERPGSVQAHDGACVTDTWAPFAIHTYHIEPVG